MTVELILFGTDSSEELEDQKSELVVSARKQVATVTEFDHIAISEAYLVVLLD